MAYVVMTALGVAASGQHEATASVADDRRAAGRAGAGRDAGCRNRNCRDRESGGCDDRGEPPAWVVGSSMHDDSPYL